MRSRSTLSTECYGAGVTKATEPRPCRCGCGGLTKGGQFRPGHDHRALGLALAGHLDPQIVFEGMPAMLARFERHLAGRRTS